MSSKQIEFLKFLTAKYVVKQVKSYRNRHTNEIVVCDTDCYEIYIDDDHEHIELDFVNDQTVVIIYKFLNDHDFSELVIDEFSLTESLFELIVQQVTVIDFTK